MIGLHWTDGKGVPLTPRDSHGAHLGGTLMLSSDDVSSDRKVTVSHPKKVSAVKNIAIAIALQE